MPFKDVYQHLIKLFSSLTRPYNHLTHTGTSFMRNVITIEVQLGTILRHAECLKNMSSCYSSQRGWISFNVDANNSKVNIDHLSNLNNINDEGVNALTFKDMTCDEKIIVFMVSESTARFNSFTNENLCRYLHSQSVGTYIIDGLINRNSSLEKLQSVIYGLSMSLSVINIPIYLQIDKTREKNYVLLLSVYPSVNLTYHRQENHM